MPKLAVLLAQYKATEQKNQQPTNVSAYEAGSVSGTSEDKGFFNAGGAEKVVEAPAEPTRNSSEDIGLLCAGGSSKEPEYQERSETDDERDARIYEEQQFELVPMQRPTSSCDADLDPETFGKEWVRKGSR
jgi:hypothetical protein